MHATTFATIWQRFQTKNNFASHIFLKILCRNSILTSRGKYFSNWTRHRILLYVIAYSRIVATFEQFRYGFLVTRNQSVTTTKMIWKFTNCNNKILMFLLTILYRYYYSYKRSDSELLPGSGIICSRSSKNNKIADKLKSNFKKICLKILDYV